MDDLNLTKIKKMKIKHLRKIKMGAGFVVFLIFFGVAFLEAFRSKNWVVVGFWILMALLFLLLDSGKGSQNYTEEA